VLRVNGLFTRLTGRQNIALTTAQEVPAPSSAPASTGNAVVTYAGGTLTVTATYSGLSSDLVSGNTSYPSYYVGHVHNGVAGQSGPIVFVFTNLSGGTSGSVPTQSFTLNDANRALLANQSFYINLHTVNNPSGEIRGQIICNSAVKNLPFAALLVALIVTSGLVF
jgi:hypothetical protein